MTTTTSIFIASKLAEATQTTQYTASTGVTIIDKFTATNVGSVNASLSVNLVESGGSVGTYNLIVDAKTLNPGDTYTFPELIGQVLASGYEISTIASVASTLSIKADGRVIVS